MIRALLLWPVKVGVIAAALWYVLRDPLPHPADWIVAVLAAVLLHLAYAAVMTDIRRAGDARLLKNAGLGVPPADGKRTALVGTLEPTSAPITAPFSRTECAGYSYEIVHFVYTPSRQGTTGTTRRVPDFGGVALAPCVIHTINGSYRLLSYPFLSGFPEQQFRDDEHVARAAEYVHATTFRKVEPFIGDLAALDEAMRDTEGALRRDWRMNDSNDVRGCTISEQCIPANAKVCAFGIYSDAKKSLVPDTASDSRSLLLVAGDADQAMQTLTSGMKSSRNLAIASFVPAVAVVAFVLFAPWTILSRVPGGSLIVDKQTERLKDALGDNNVREITGALRYLDPNLAVDEALHTPLMFVTTIEAGSALVARGASVTAHDANGYSVLMNVAQRGSPALLAFLVEHGANVNERTGLHGATTPLSIAKEANTPDAVAALVRAGARD